MDFMESERDSSWWSRPCGVREVLTLALPLVISTMSWTIMSFIDRTFLMWYSTDAMAAAMPASAVSFSFICLAMGVASYVGTFVAQYNGAQQFERIGPIVWQGVWIGVGCIPVFFALRSLSPYLFDQVGHPATITQLETAYFKTLCWGAAAVVISSALSGFFSGREETVVIMVVSAVAALLNIALDYAWIFGKAGFPEGGIVGAATATNVSEWAKAVIYLVLMIRRDRQGTFGVLRRVGIDRVLMRRLIWFGGPNGLQMFVETAAFSAYLLLVGRLGENELAATTLAFNVNQIAFVPMLGLGFAASILVGNQIGKQRLDLAERATWTTLSIAILYAGLMAALYWTLPDTFLILHKIGADVHEFEAVRDITVVLLRFVAVYCIWDAVLIVFSSAIKGAGDTRFVLLAAMALSPIPVISGWIGIEYWNWTLMHFWFLVTAWIITQAFVYFARFMQGRWRTMSVIETT